MTEVSECAENASAESELHPWQRWKPATVHRSQLKNAPYNPRTINQAAKKKLKKVLGSLGVIEGLVWNRRTGNLVGGHQRLSLLDGASKSKDYSITVCEVDMSEDEEERANLALNNWNAQGDFDPEKLKALLARHQAKLEDTGFDTVDVVNLFGDQVTKLESDRLQQMADKLREARRLVKEMADSASKRDSECYYLVVVFRDNQTCLDFCEQAQLPPRNPGESREEWEDRVSVFIKGDELAERLGHG